MLSSIALACKQISSLVTRAGVSNLTGVAGSANESVSNLYDTAILMHDTGRLHPVLCRLSCKQEEDFLARFPSCVTLWQGADTDSSQAI